MVTKKKGQNIIFFISKLPYNIDFSEIWCQKYALFFQFMHYFRLFWILFSKVCFFKNTLLWWRKKKVKILFFLSKNYPIIATFLKFDVKSMLFFFNLSIIFDFSEFCFQKCVFQKHPTMVTKKKGQKIFFSSKFHYNGDFSEYCCQKCLFQKHPTMVTKKIKKNGIPLRLSFPLFLLPDCRWHQI